MKKILLVALLMLFTCRISFAETLSSNNPDNVFTNDSEETQELHGYVEYEEEPQEIFLDEQPESEQNTIYMKSTTGKKDLSLKAPEKLGSSSLNAKLLSKKIQTPDANRLEAASKFSAQEYDINPVSGTYSGQSGKFSFGTTYDSSVDSAQVNYSTGMFSRFDGKHFAISTAYSRSTQSGYDSYTDKVYVAPELKLTKRLSILDIAQSNIVTPSKKNEIVLRYRPPLKKYADDVQFELGAGQNFYENQAVNSTVRFSTRFKL